MKCPKCNFEVSENAKFCPECGENMLESMPRDTFANVEQNIQETNSETETPSKKSILKKIKIAAIVGTASVVIVAIALLLVFVVFKHEHDWVYTTTKEPTYREEGARYRFCEGCGTEEYYSSIPRITISELIDSITDAESCFIATEAYYALPEKEQENVYNAWDLKQAMELYSSDTRICEYLMKYSAKEKLDGIRNLTKNRLLNPDSYIEKNQSVVAFYDDTSNTYCLYITIDYSAQNKAGGYSASYTKDYFTWNGTTWIPTYDVQLSLKMVNYTLEVYKFYSFD